MFHRVGELFLQTELAAEMYVDEVLAGDGSVLHLDSPGSVSASECPPLHWGSPEQLSTQRQRHLHALP